MVLWCRLPQLIDLSRMVLCSRVIGQRSGGLSQRLLVVLQRLGGLLVVALALLGLVLLVAGLVRFGRAVLAKAPPRSAATLPRR